MKTPEEIELLLEHLQSNIREENAKYLELIKNTFKDKTAREQFEKFEIYDVSEYFEINTDFALDMLAWKFQLLLGKFIDDDQEFSEQHSGEKRTPFEQEDAAWETWKRYCEVQKGPSPGFGIIDSRHQSD